MERRLFFRKVLAGFALGLFAVQVAEAATVRIVSDIDDTTKIANVGSPLKMLWNSMFSNRAFVGMKELYTSFSLERAYAFHYLTAASAVMRADVRDFLETNGFPEGEIKTRPIFRDLYSHKFGYLKELLETYPEDQFILIGDDGQKDAEIYDEIYRYAPERFLAIYIRKVKNRPLPPSIYPFVTAYDIARLEFKMGRFTEVEASPVAMRILAEKNDRLVVPKFAYCPTKRDYSIANPKIEEWSDRIFVRVQKICHDRDLPFEIY